MLTLVNGQGIIHDYFLFNTIFSFPAYYKGHLSHITNNNNNNYTNTHTTLEMESENLFSKLSYPCKLNDIREVSTLCFIHRLAILPYKIVLKLTDIMHLKSLFNKKIP